MYRIALCDDNPHQTDKISDIIERYLHLHKIDFEIDVYDSGEKLLDAIDYYHEKYQILFLDIQMRQLNGIETAKRIRVQDRDILIVYITSYDKYTLESFEVSPFRYLLKPVASEKIENVLDLSIQEINKRHQFFFFNIGQEQHQIRSSQIISAVSVLGRKISINVEGEGIFEFYGKMRELEKELDSFYFVRTNSGTLLNMAFIKFITPQNVIHLKNGVTSSVSRSRSKEFHEKYSHFMENELTV